MHIKVDVYNKNLKEFSEVNCANQIKKINWLIEGRVRSINDDEIYVNDNGFIVLFCKLGLPDFFSFDMQKIFLLQPKTISVNPTSGLSPGKLHNIDWKIFGHRIWQAYYIYIHTLYLFSMLCNMILRSFYCTRKFSII